MAVTYGFYDSLNHDRLYNAQQMSAIFDGIINDGVFMSVGNQFHTMAGSGMQVIVKSGRAWFDSTWTLNDAEYPLSIDAADVLLTRVDAVVLEVNSEVATRANTIKVIKGTPASTPAKPTLTNTATIHQHALAYVTVAKNTTAITNSMIEIVVGKTETPYVTAILQTTDITDLYNQWEDYFQTWFDTVRGTLDGDVALNLQNQITSLRRETLKNTTPPIIGLPASATPDDMFRALGNTGELHVWRKTVTQGNAVDASYTVDDVTVDRRYTGDQTLPSPALICWGKSGVAITVANSFTLNPTTNLITLSNSVNYSYGNNAFPSSDVLVGKYVYLEYPSTYGPANLSQALLYYIPNDASITRTNNWIYCDKLQYVNVTPYVPAGTTTTYPVSTNPNAYQEGEYGKAGYTLGDVKTGTFQIGQDATTIAANRAIIKYGASISVTDTGTASIASESELTVTSDSSQSAVNKLKGNFFRFSQLPFSSSAFSVGTIYFFPANTVFTKQSSGNWYASKYQTVTSHGKTEPEYTIEYLGKLGDKARVQFGSYVGTGTYGSSNPNSLNLSFTPRFLLVMKGDRPTSSRSYANFALFVYGVANGITVGPSSGNYEIPLYATWNKNSISWYNSNSDYGDTGQMNESGTKYRYVAIG